MISWSQLTLGFGHLVCWHLFRYVKILMLKMQRKISFYLSTNFYSSKLNRRAKLLSISPNVPSLLYIECCPAPSHFPLSFLFIHTLLFSSFLWRFPPPHPPPSPLPKPTLGASLVAQTVKSHPLMQTRDRSKWHTSPVFLAGESHGWRSLVGYSQWGREESDVTEHTRQIHSS